MEQLLAHLVGDYIFQTDKQATLKRKDAWQCLAHALTYGIAFLLLHPSAIAWTIIVGTHFLIDHFGLARFVVRLKNSLGSWSTRNDYDTPTGYPATMPPFLSVWLLIIADNTMHLLINYVALRLL